MVLDFLDNTSYCRYTGLRQNGVYHRKISQALENLDGTALPNLLAGPVFDVLFREVSCDDFERRSHILAKDVGSYMKRVLRTLLERQCKQYPGLLKEIGKALVGDFMKSKEDKAMEAVSNAVKAEMGLVFTLDAFYSETIAGVHKMVDSVRKGAPLADVWNIPGSFIGQMAKVGSDSVTFAVFNLQVCFTSIVSRRISMHCYRNIRKTPLETEW